MNPNVAGFLVSVLGKLERDGGSTTALGVIDLRPRLQARDSVFTSISVRVAIVALDVGVFAHGQL